MEKEFLTPKLKEAINMAIEKLQNLRDDNEGHFAMAIGNHEKTDYICFCCEDWQIKSGLEIVKNGMKSDNIKRQRLN